ncbi:TPA: leucine-rich repeat domain-containing protein [Streptococcus equi subsp. zooepidemicus]|nr:leucine-rich repeat domain-containing protein [Streptococcus equi subsp. zooepidemicus]HEL0097651.1 leucine-rich repeat domain-containing protein [Streptococcus equi subsp. zooepidemicus]
MTIKKCPQILALFLALAALASQGQTVHALERQETSVKQAHESDDWFDEDEDFSAVKSNTSTEIDSTVTDLFGDAEPKTKAGKEELKAPSSKQEALPAEPQKEKETSAKPTDHATAQVEEAQPEQDSDNPWLADDFVTKGDTLVGLSKAGLAKLSKTPVLTLPRIGADKTVLTRIASFAFTPNKSVAIADYTGRAGEHGEINHLDVEGRNILTEGEDFGAYAIKKLVIPEGYLFIGQDAFNDNKQLEEISLADSLLSISDYAFAHMSLSKLKLPKSLQSIGDQAFFDNRIAGTLVLPKALKQLGERAFKSNRLTGLVFEGEGLSVLKEAAFQDNAFISLVIPDSIQALEEDVFTGNLGDEEYGNHVVLRTKSGQNPYRLHSANVLVNPSDQARTPQPPIDYNKWLAEDFTYTGQMITGFSASGLRKVKRNKHLVLPKDYQGQPLTAIADNAFRNVDFHDKALRKYDLERVTLPSTIQKIGAFAFQSNNLESFEASEDLVDIGQGAFMNNRIEILTLNDKLRVIGDAAFHINRIYAIVIPESVEVIGISVFRQNGAKHVVFMGDKLTSIGEMAFLSNTLEEVDLSSLAGLKTIAVQAFADNHLRELKLPDNLIRIQAEAFKANRLQGVTVPDTVISISFNAFDNNSDDKVILRTINHNKNLLADGDGFIVDPDLLSADQSSVQAVLEDLQRLDLASLRADTAAHFTTLITRGKQLLKESAVRLGYQLRFLAESRFFLGRVRLDQLIKSADIALSNHQDTPNAKLLMAKLDKAKLHYNNSAMTAPKISRLEKELSLLIDLVQGVGAISKATMTQGVYKLQTTLPIPEYYIGVNLYTDDQGNILFVLDMSDTIGQGQLDDYGNPILNVDEDNEGYHALAIESLADYEGLTIKDILTKELNQLPIRDVKQAREHRVGLFMAIRDAAREAQLLLEKQSKALSESAGKSNGSKVADSGLEPSVTLSTNKTKKLLPKTGAFKEAWVTMIGMLVLLAAALLKGDSRYKKRSK